MTEDEKDELVRFLIDKPDEDDKTFAFYYVLLLVVFMVYYSCWFLLDRVYVNKVLAGIMTFGPFSNHPKYSLLEVWFIAYYILYYHRAWAKEKLVEFKNLIRSKLTCFD